jgi:hypothetical protein
MLAVLRRSPNHRDAARRKRELEILAGVRRAPPVHAAWRRKGSARAAPVQADFRVGLTGEAPAEVFEELGIRAHDDDQIFRVTVDQWKQRAKLQRTALPPADALVVTNRNM